MLSYEDIYTFSSNIRLYYVSDRFLEALNLCKIIDNKISKSLDEELKFESAIIYYWYSNLCYDIGEKVNAVKYANITLNLISFSKKRTASILDEEALNLMSKHLKELKILAISNSKNTSSINNNRNKKIKVKYKNGVEVEKKYKQLEADLLSGKCSIIQ